MYLASISDITCSKYLDIKKRVFRFHVMSLSSGSRGYKQRIRRTKRSKQDLKFSNFKGFIQECYKSNDTQKVLQEVHNDFSGQVSPIVTGWTS